MSGTLRVRELGAVAREVQSMLGVPPGFDTSLLLETFIDGDLLAAVDLNGTMDVVNIDAPHRRSAAAFTLRPDSESLLREKFELRPEGALVHVVKKDHDMTNRTYPECALYLGRLVCAHDEKTLVDSAPYLVTTLAAEPLDHAIRVSVPGTTIRDRDPDKAAPEEDRFATELVRGLKREIDRIDVDVDLGATFEATLTVRLLSREAPLTRALVPSGPIGPPPPAFDRLPSDALLAIWSNGASAEDLAPLKKAIIDDLQSTLESDGYAKEAAKASLDELASLFLTGGPFVLATGKTKTTWFVAAVDEPAQRWTNGFRALVKKSDEAERTRKKPANPSARRRPDGDDIAARVVAVPASAKLPPDSLHIELKLTPKKKGVGQIRIAHLWVVPQGDRTWIAYGDDDAAVRERVRAARDNSPSTSTRATTHALAGGHSTTNALVTLFAPEKSAPLATGGADRISISAVTDPKALVVKLHGSKQAAIDLAKTFF
jgi:hypothetical protein